MVAVIKIKYLFNQEGCIFNQCALETKFSAPFKFLKDKNCIFSSSLFLPLNACQLNDLSESVSLLLNPRVLGWQQSLHKTAGK